MDKIFEKDFAREKVLCFEEGSCGGGEAPQGAWVWPPGRDADHSDRLLLKACIKKMFSEPSGRRMFSRRPPGVRRPPRRGGEASGKAAGGFPAELTLSFFFFQTGGRVVYPRRARAKPDESVPDAGQRGSENTREPLIMLALANEESIASCRASELRKALPRLRPLPEGESVLLRGSADWKESENPELSVSDQPPDNLDIQYFLKRGAFAEWRNKLIAFVSRLVVAIAPPSPLVSSRYHSPSPVAFVSRLVVAIAPPSPLVSSHYRSPSPVAFVSRLVVAIAPPSPLVSSHYRSPSPVAFVFEETVVSLTVSFLIAFVSRLVVAIALSRLSSRRRYRSSSSVAFVLKGFDYATMES